MSDETDISASPKSAEGAKAAVSTEKLAKAKALVEGLLQRLGVEAVVEVRDSAEAIACNLEVKSGAALFEIGPRGQVLEAAQHLVSKMLHRDAEDRKFVSIEVGPFRENREDPAMQAMASRLAASVVRMGKTLTVVPMGARDRRAVHVALAEVEGVNTRSEGEGPLRRLLVEHK